MEEITFRRAVEADLPAIVALLADDPLGAARESPGDLAPYRTAFAAVDADPHQLLAVAELDGEVAGTAQLTFLPGLSRRGATRAQIESVRVAAAARGSGLGTGLIAWCVAQAEQRGCALVQLTSDTSRTAAHRFYARLGFQATHVGFKLALPRGGAG